MSADTIPARVALSIVIDVLAQRAGRLANRAARNPRAQSDSKRAGRQRNHDDLMRQVRQLQALAVQGDVSAATAGLLAAWASGHAEAIAALEAITPGVEALRDDDYVGACRLLLAARER